ncbi:MAG: pyridoxal phosphate-dependent aminotransferase [Candidatus Acidiferrales bacterium]
MSPSRREVRTPYIEWAKLRANARFNLATSGMAAYPLEKLGARLEDFQVSGSDSYGYPPLQERLAKKCGVTPECVVAAIGTSMANHLAMAALLEPGDEVLIEHPAYEPLLKVAEYLGARVMRFHRRWEDDFRVNPAEIERQLSPRTRLIVLTNLHNPSSARVDDATLAAIGSLAHRVGAQVLVDEVYLEAIFDEPWRSSFLLDDNFIATSSLTKAYGLSGLRCGWVLAHPALAERMWRLNDLFGVIPAHLAECLSVLALDHLPEIAARAREQLEKNRKLVRDFLSTRIDLAVARIDCGTVVFPEVLSGDPELFIALLREKYQTTVAPGRFFEMPRHFRLGLGGDSGVLEEGLRRIGCALGEISR